MFATLRLPRRSIALLTLAGAVWVHPLHGFAAPIIIDDFTVAPFDVAADSAGNSSMRVEQVGLDMDHVWSGDRFFSAGTFARPLPDTPPIDATITVSEAEGLFTYRANDVPERLYFSYGASTEGTVLADLSSNGGKIVIDVVAASGFDEIPMELGLRNESGGTSTQRLTIRDSSDPYQLVFELRDSSPTIDLANIIAISFAIPTPGPELSIRKIAFVPEPTTRRALFAGLAAVLPFFTRKITK
jgi:hypothetical protein